MALAGKAEQRKKKKGAIGVREASKDKKPALESKDLSWVYHEGNGSRRDLLRTWNIQTV